MLLVVFFFKILYHSQSGKIDSTSSSTSSEQSESHRPYEKPRGPVAYGFHPACEPRSETFSPGSSSIRTAVRLWTSKTRTLAALTMSHVVYVVTASQ